MVPQRRVSEDSRGSVDFGASRVSRFFVSDIVRAQILGWMVKALSNKRVVQKMDGGHSTFVLEHAWIFQFIDIIYVGTIFKLSHLIGHCGRGIDVYIICIAYFAIMFSTRLSFDVYTCISGASGILHLVAFCFYGMGVYIMTVNISSHLQSAGTYSHDDAGAMHVSHYGTALTGTVTYGSCERSIDYDTAFAVAFIFTRGVLIVMYGLYFYVFHESNQVGLAPDMALFAKGLRLSDLTRDSESEAVKDFHRASIDSRSQHSVDHVRPASVDHFRPGAAVEKPSVLHGGASSVTGNPLRKESKEKKGVTSATAHTPLHVPTHAPPASAMHRTSFVMRVTHKYGEQAVKLHFTRIFVLKVAPVILSSLAMCAMFAGVSPVIVLPVVAIIEMIGDFLPSYFIHHAADWRELVPSRHFLEERLGLFFMLVLGEVVLGFSSVSYYAENMGPIYKVLLFSFFSIFTVGMQYFEPLQSYTKPEGPHPLDVQQLNPFYIWLVCLASFFMLVAGNGMVQLYGQVAENQAALSLSNGDVTYQKEKVANGLGAVTLLIIVLKILDKVYYRERLLPRTVFAWLDAFYKKTEAEHKESPPSYPLRGAGEGEGGSSHGSEPLSGRLSNDSDFGPGQALGSSQQGSKGGDVKGDGGGGGGSTHDRASLRASSISSRHGDVLLSAAASRPATMQVVDKEDLGMGIRRIRPLTAVRIAVSITQFLLWSVEGIAVENFMAVYAALIVFPSFLEVVLEVRNFLYKQQQDANGGLQGSESKSNLEQDGD